MAVKMEMKVHPVADLFPMLPDDELRDLAEDIKVRGQLQPIVLDKDGESILDGRNRFAACNLAGVEPQFVTYDGDDPNGYALAVNISRRHMTKGQQALVVAKANRVPGGEKLTSREAGRVYGVDASRFRQANAILDFAPDLEGDILGGTGKFDAAYETAKQRKKEKVDRATDAESIREEAPDLADAVAEESLTLEAAKEQLRQRQEDAVRAERVALIDVLVAESGAPRTYAERVGAGEITWEEAEGLAAKWKSEWLEAADRNHRRIFDILAGWKALTSLLDSPKDSFNKAVLEKLGDNLHGDLRKAVAEMAANATKWNGAI